MQLTLINANGDTARLGIKEGETVTVSRETAAFYFLPYTGTIQGWGGIKELKVSKKTLKSTQFGAQFSR
jgi:hypothetical protein